MSRSFAIGVLAALALPALLVAQPNYTVSPRGTDLVELNSGSAIVLNWIGGNTTRTQQADNGHLEARSIKSIAWRRDGAHERSTTLSVNLDLWLGHGDFDKFSSTFSTNYSAAPTKVASGTRTLDWTKASSLPVGLWSDVLFPLAAPFAYNGKDALIFETQTLSTATTSSGYALDWESATPSHRTWMNPQVLGAGCSTNNGTMTLSGMFQVDKTPAMTLMWNVNNASANAQVRVYAGISNPNLPFLCGRLHTDATWSYFTLPDASSAGTTTNTFAASWLSLLAGETFTAQAIALDSAAPGGGYLSNGLFCRMPEVVGGTPLAVKRTYSTTSSTATTGSSVSVSCQATRFE